MPLTGRQAVIALLEKDIRAHVPNVTFGYGKAELARHGKPPRVTWVPADGAFERYKPSDFQGDNPPPIAVDKAMYTVHCWAESDEIGRDSFAESLGHQVIAAIRRVSGRWYELHQNRPDDGDGASARGWLYIFAVSIDIPITEDAWDTATLTSMPFDTSEPPPDGVLQAPGDS